MSLIRYAQKRDINEAIIIEALQGVGAFVTQLSGKGTPDILVIFRGDVFLMEVKAPKAKLTPAQVEWHGTALNAGYGVPIVVTIADALRVIGAVD